MSYTFEARYHSKCGACGDQIRPGDPVRWHDPDEYERGGGVVIHDECREPADPLAVTAEPCPRCFMVPASNGECGC